MKVFNKSNILFYAVLVLIIISVITAYTLRPNWFNTNKPVQIIQENKQPDTIPIYTVNDFQTQFVKKVYPDPSDINVSIGTINPTFNSPDSIDITTFSEYN